MRAAPRRIHPIRCLVLLAVSAFVASACGSTLSEEEVLARSATAVSGAVGGTAAGSGSTGSPGASTASGAGGGGGTGAVAASSGTGGTGGGATGGAAPGAAVDAGAGTTGEAAGNGSACTTQDTGPIVIATVGNYSGAGGSAQGGFPPAVQAWASNINSQGGLCGREVQVVVQDDGGDQARYASLARDSVENRKAVAFVGNGAVLSAAGGLSYHQQSGVPVIGNDCTNAHWYNSPVLFPTCPTAYDQTTSFVINGIQLFGTNKFGYVYCTEAQTCLDIPTNLNNGGLQAAGAELLYQDSVSIAQIDFTAECQAARGAGVELFWVGADPATVSRMVQSCSRQNYFPHYLCGSVSCGAGSFTVKGFENAALATPVFPFTSGSGGAIDEYNRVRDTFAPDITPSVDFSIGWTSAKLFELAATRAAQATGTITSQTLIDALYAMENETLGGLTAPLNFGPEGARPGNCYFAMQGDGSGGFITPNGSTAICR